MSHLTHHWKTTSDGWDHLVQEFHAGPLPDLLNYGSQLLVSFLKVPWRTSEKTSWNKSIQQSHCIVVLCHDCCFKTQLHYHCWPEGLRWTTSWTSDQPSVFIFRAVRTRAKSVALKVTVPSLFRGMFMETSLCEQNTHTHTILSKYMLYLIPPRHCFSKKILLHWD